MKNLLAWLIQRKDYLNKIMSVFYFFDQNISKYRLKLFL